MNRSGGLQRSVAGQGPVDPRFAARFHVRASAPLSPLQASSNSDYHDRESYPYSSAELKAAVPPAKHLMLNSSGAQDDTCLGDRDLGGWRCAR